MHKTSARFGSIWAWTQTGVGFKEEWWQWLKQTPLQSLGRKPRGSPDFQRPWPTLPKGALCYVSCPTVLKSDTEELYAAAPLRSSVSNRGQRIHLRIKISHEDLVRLKKRFLKKRSLFRCGMRATSLRRPPLLREQSRACKAHTPGGELNHSEKVAGVTMLTSIQGLQPSSMEKSAPKRKKLKTSNRTADAAEPCGVQISIWQAHHWWFMLTQTCGRLLFIVFLSAVTWTVNELSLRS